jgi:hypothetical protein
VKPNKFSGALTIKTGIERVIRDFFRMENRNLGETLKHSEIVKLILDSVDGIDFVEIAMNKDKGDKIKADEYNVNATVESNQTIAEVKRRKILELLGKDPDLIKIAEPLLDIKNPITNKREWVFSVNIEMNKYEFPLLGDIVIEVDGE